MHDHALHPPDPGRALPPDAARSPRYLRLPAAAAMLLLLAACAAPRPARERPPRLVPADHVVPAFPVPSVRDRMVFLARQEWALFGSPVVSARRNGGPSVGADGNGGNGASPGNGLVFADPARPTHELQGPMLTRVLLYWYAVSPEPIVGRDGGLRPWSAAFVSWVARGAGLAPTGFPATVLHWDYIERALQPGTGDAFVAREPARHAPRPGDLVCNTRADPSTAAGAPPPGLGALRRGPYHCELVVEAGPGWVDSIGGNVADTVALTRWPVDADGRLLPHPRQRWAAVLELRVR
jgi:hypothetical protein